jgi:hypothetical protein
MRKVAVFCVLMALCLPAAAFNVVRNVNDGRPPEDKYVIFEAGKTPAANVVLENREGECPIRINAAGQIEATITGNGPIQPTISWTPASGIPETIDARDYNFVMLRCALEGTQYRTFPNGQTKTDRRDNLWMGLSLFTVDNERIGIANLAVLTDDQRTPDKMVTLKIPMSMLTSGAYYDLSKVSAVGFRWGGTHDYYNRDFQLKIEKISLAN